MLFFDGEAATADTGSWNNPTNWYPDGVPTPWSRVVMDEAFDPSGLSGSPFLSRHTGKVIGMAIATTIRGGKLLGLHPIGSLVEKAEAARTLPKIVDYRR